MLFVSIQLLHAGNQHEAFPGHFDQLVRSVNSLRTEWYSNIQPHFDRYAHPTRLEKSPVRLYRTLVSKVTAA